MPAQKSTRRWLGKLGWHREEAAWAKKNLGDLGDGDAKEFAVTGNCVADSHEEDEEANEQERESPEREKSGAALCAAAKRDVGCDKSRGRGCVERAEVH
mmetsp:Transcript_9196/g.20008  ORF Transcript_9196/g.20008 Transcript_9196/m.20008 type:complete len:99 (+) Transcript_9196:172-468(+)